MLIHRLALPLLLVALVASSCGDDSDDVSSTNTTTIETTEAPTVDEPDTTPTTIPVDTTVEADPPAVSDGVEAEGIARLFVDAVAAGDYESAASVAAQPALDFFEPWEPVPGAGFQSITDDRFTLILGPGYLVTCELDADLDVASCAEVAESGTDDIGDTQPAFDDPAAYYLVDYLAPELGGFPETREGAIVRGSADAYVVDYTTCCTDDTLYANISSLEDNAVIRVHGPDGSVLDDEVMTTNLVLEQGGEYWIVVGSTRGNATYTIEIGLAQNAG